ncbi:MAG TPA: hypothetical protein VLF91_04730 [Candidatus Saccharimonadales bacterium]|nr:hypothetical protein [Candidatus Saccharimonadales bacterium]
MTFARDHRLPTVGSATAPIIDKATLVLVWLWRDAAERLGAYDPIFREFNPPPDETPDDIICSCGTRASGLDRLALTPRSRNELAFDALAVHRMACHRGEVDPGLVFLFNDFDIDVSRVRPTLEELGIADLAFVPDCFWPLLEYVG